VVGYKAELVKKELGDSVVYVEQKEQLGTGHAVLTAEEAAGEARNILVLQGDMPFISSGTIKNLLERHFHSAAKITVATTVLPDFNDWRGAFMNFGRIVRRAGEIIIREYKDATPAEREVKEVNAGAYVFDAEWLWPSLKKIKNENAQGEYYLTDLLQMASVQKASVKTVQIDPREALGANTLEELEILEKLA
jgi:bifunctional UDP-N-acetylglucosamine pyrophosphorylase / glucosamine-1-phosphate N-acetyltransferase